MSETTVRLSRSTFQLIANILSRHNASEEMVRAFATELKQTNPRFNEQRFIAACKPIEQEPAEPVGVLVDGNIVFCFGCEPLNSHKVPIYRVNIAPYKQTCAKCRKVLVAGQSSAWPELFSGKVA